LSAAASDFRWLHGAARVRGNAVPEPRHCARDFCADCGSPAPSAAEDGTVMLPAGALDTRLPALPAVHAYVGAKAPWVSIADPWPQFDGPPPAELSDSFR
jgi:hypothetical protein